MNVHIHVHVRQALKGCYDLRMLICLVNCKLKFSEEFRKKTGQWVPMEGLWWEHCEDYAIKPVS